MQAGAGAANMEAATVWEELWTWRGVAAGR